MGNINISLKFQIIIPRLVSKQYFSNSFEKKGANYQYDKKKGHTQCRRLPALSGVWRRVSI